MFDQKGKLEQVAEATETFQTLNPLGLIAVLAGTTILLILIGIGGWIYVVLKKKIKQINSNGSRLTLNVNEELKVIHKRIDKTNDKMDELIGMIGKLNSDVGYVRGKLDK